MKPVMWVFLIFGVLVCIVGIFNLIRLMFHVRGLRRRSFAQAEEAMALAAALKPAAGPVTYTSGPVTYTIEKGANVWPGAAKWCEWRSKSEE